MDPILNPFAPGAGTRPPELAGRNEVREASRIALARKQIGRPAKSTLMVGLRGVGKTVLLDRIREDAEARGIYALSVEAPETRSLPSILAPQLRQVLLRLSRRAAAGHLAQRGLRALAGFATALKVKYQDIEIGLDFEPEPGLADNGDLETDLQDLLQAVGEAASADASCVALLIDELQYVEEDQLAALITALHRTAQRQLPVTMIGAGLPQVRGRMGRAKSYAERLFDFPEIGALSHDDARHAIAKPARAEGVQIKPDALDLIVERTQGYPYFLQEWGKHTWDVAESSPITAADVEAASQLALAGSRPEFLPAQVRAADAGGEALPARNGHSRARAAPLRRHCTDARTAGDFVSTHSQPTDQQGHGVEPKSRIHRVYRADVRSVHVAHHAGRFVAARLNDAADICGRH